MGAKKSTCTSLAPTHFWRPQFLSTRQHPTGIDNAPRTTEISAFGISSKLELVLARAAWGVFSHPVDAHDTEAPCGVDPLRFLFCEKSC